MHDPLITALRDWQSFYTFLGTAAATLAGLLFVAIQLGVGVRLPHGMPSAIQTFVVPIYVHFVDVMVIAALTLIPTETHLALGSVLFIPAFVNVWTVSVVLRRSLYEYERAELGKDHWIWNVCIPSVAHVLLLLSAVGFLLDLRWALNTLAIATIAFLVTGFVNAGQITLWLMQRQIAARERSASTEAVSEASEAGVGAHERTSS